MKPDKVIGTRIREAREAAGLSQSGLAAALQARGLDLPPQTIYKIEQGLRKLLAAEVPIFAAVLGTSPSALLGLGVDRGPLLLSGARLEEATRNLQSAALAYGRAMLSYAQAADTVGDLDPSDEDYATHALPKQTPGWIATADVIGSIEASLKLNRVELTGTFARSTIEALRQDHERYHADG